MMSKNVDIYSKGKRVKDAVIDGYIDDLFKKETIEKKNEEVIKVVDAQYGYECEICRKNKSKFLFDGLMVCTWCAAEEIRKDREVRENYKEVLRELKNYWFGRMYDEDMAKMKSEYEKIRDSKEKGKELVSGICMWCGRDESDIVAIEVYWAYKTFKCMRCYKKW